MALGTFVFFLYSELCNETGPYEGEGGFNVAAIWSNSSNIGLVKERSEKKLL